MQQYTMYTPLDTSPNATRVNDETVPLRAWLEQWPPARRSLISNLFHYAVRDGATTPAVVVRAVQTALHRRLGYAVPSRNATDETLYAVCQALQAAPSEAYPWPSSIGKRYPLRSGNNRKQSAAVTSSSSTWPSCR
jgi:hypothetical protein